MDGYVLSYNPNDFFWVSVKDNFDFQQCKFTVDKQTPSPTDASGSATLAPTACPVITCPAADTAANMDWQAKWDSNYVAPMTSPPPLTAEVLFNELYVNASTVSTTPPAMNQELLRSNFAAALCKNYQESNQLLSVQNEITTSQALFSDSDGQYGYSIQNILNISVGIGAALVLGIAAYQ